MLEPITRTLYVTSQTVKIVSICDFNKNKLSELGSEIKNAKQTQNAEDILNDPDINLEFV